jgi:hypothetical protein
MDDVHPLVRRKNGFMFRNSGRKLLAALFLPFVIGALAPAARADDASPDRTAELRKILLAQPGMREQLLASYKGQAATSVRLEWLIRTGVMCRLLAEDDAKTIFAAGNAELEYAASLLADEDKSAAEIYLDGVRAGAFRSAEVISELNDEACRHFGRPGGPLTKIMTWTGKRQYTAQGTAPRNLCIPNRS